MKKIKVILPIFLTIVLIITQTGCKSDTPIATDTDYYLLDTVCQIDVYALNVDKAKEKINMEDETEEGLAKELVKEAFDQCKKYENILSKTREGSDIYKINNAGGKPTSVCKETVEVLKKGIEYGDLSEGKFDITIGAVTEMWDFEGHDPIVPDKDKVSEAQKTVDYKQIKIAENEDGSGTVTMGNPKAKIDLGGIAKGYICDICTSYLEERGVTSAVVNLGGNITAIGKKPSGEEFNIGVERPYSKKSEVVGSIDASDKTMVTSGVYERCFEKDGKTYHHILDNKTGFPAETDVELVTIIGDKNKSVDCDCLSTMCLMMGAEKAKEFIEKMPNMEAVIIDKNNKTVCTSGANLKTD